jgi:anion-transporting  ArsA/GET3 family ATPase
VKDLLRKGNVLVVLGPGGVGKTTVAAALGLAGAVSGLDTALITVDPARRLRDALGLERMAAQPIRVDSRRLRAAGLDSATRLSAMMLDVERTWDRLVEEFIENPAARCRIRENAFYRSLTRQFAGADAYAALEQLYQLHASAGFELEIVDTPPAAHAFEFFEAPEHLVSLLDSRATRWLFREQSLGHSALALAGRAAAFVLTQLETFAGTRTFSAIWEFFDAAAQAAGAISERFRQTGAMLHSANVSFVLITTATEDRLKEARELVERTEREELNLRGIVLNRMLDERTFDAILAAPERMPDHLADIRNLRGAISAEKPIDSRLDALIGYLESYSAAQQIEIERTIEFARRLPSDIQLAIAPEMTAGLRNLRSLARLGGILTGTISGRELLNRVTEAFGIGTDRGTRRRGRRRD